MAYHMNFELKLANRCELTARMWTLLGLLSGVYSHSMHFQVSGDVGLKVTSGPIALKIP